MAINASGDGSGGSDGTLTLAVGAPGANEGEGAVYVGRTTEPGKWTSPFQFGPALIPAFPDAADEFHTEGFGASVALTGGVMLAVGAPNDPNFEEEIEGTGAVWLFTWADGSFVPNETQAHLYGPLEGMAFGASVAIPETSPADSNGALYSPAAHLFVGAPGAVSDQPTCVYRFVNDSGDGPITGGSFTADAQYVGSSPQEGDGFGRARGGCQLPGRRLEPGRGDRQPQGRGAGRRLPLRGRGPGSDVDGYADAHLGTAPCVGAACLPIGGRSSRLRSSAT